jgi:hydrogenase maturation protease
VQPVELDDYGGSLRPAVKAQITPAIDMALEYLAGFGVPGEKRETPLAVDRAAGAIADISRYEEERPTPDQACRVGDGRVLLSDNFSVAYRPADIEGVSVPVDQHLDKYRKESR